MVWQDAQWVEEATSRGTAHDQQVAECSGIGRLSDDGVLVVVVVLEEEDR
jgi:hypothetical protein